MQTITIDARMILNSGIGTYIQNLLPLVIDKKKDTHFVLLGRVEELKQFTWTNERNISIIDCRAPIYSISEQFDLIRKIPAETSLFWSPHYNIPIFYSGTMLVTIHDIYHMVMPKSPADWKKRFYAKLMFNAVKYKGSAIITVSEFTKTEILRLLEYKEKKLHTIYNGVNHSWFSILKDKVPHDRPYLLYVGNVKPHKNLITLIQAFQMLANKTPHDLIIVGKKEGFITGDNEAINKAEALGDRIKFTGYLSEKELKQYFIHAEALVFPSLYEGFGLPPIEAMACGCPVIASNAASIPEICGQAALYFNPYSFEDLANKILYFLSNPELRREFRLTALEHAKKYTWEKCSNDTISVIEEVLSH